MKTGGRFSAPPQLVQERVSATVKWFNASKGFGFVQIEGGDDDAFLHASVLQPGIVLNEGAKLVCDVSQGQRGLQVATVHDIEAGSGPAMGGGGGAMDADFGGGGMGPSERIDGTVKFYNAAKGFGFVVPDNGGRDVFISAATLARAGLAGLEPRQRVRIGVKVGQKGPMAHSVEATD